MNAVSSDDDDPLPSGATQSKAATDIVGPYISVQTSQEYESNVCKLGRSDPRQLHLLQLPISSNRNNILGKFFAQLNCEISGTRIVILKERYKDKRF